MSSLLFDFRPLPGSQFEDATVLPLGERRIAGMAGLVGAGIVPRVVAADQTPARLVAVIGRAAVEQVAMEKERITGFHLTIDRLQVLPRQLDPLRVRPRLTAGLAVLDAAHALRPFEHLQA